MKQRNLVLALLFSIVTLFSFSQDKPTSKLNGKDLFSKIYNSYSGKKLSYVTLKDGSKIVGYKKDVDRKKGQIYYIKLKQQKTKKKFKLESDEIKEMYLYPGGVQKFFKTLNHIYDVRQWERSDLDNDVLKQGYIYFKNQKVSLKNKKKEKEYLMQLVNAPFSKYIEVYGDPFAKETTKLGIGGFNLAGGLQKSYYVKKNGKIFWLRKKNLKDYYETLFGDSKEFKNKYPVEDVKWRYFSEYIAEYTNIRSKE